MDWKEYKQQVISRLRPEDIYGGIKQQSPTTDGWVMGLCPLHKDKNPSFAFCVNASDKHYLRWICFAKCGQGSCIDFLMITNPGSSFKSILMELGNKVGIPVPHIQKKNPPIEESTVEQWHKNLMDNESILQYISDHRGLTTTTLKKYKIGWDDKKQRNTIPIRDKKGKLVNIRKYNKKKKKMEMINYVMTRKENGKNVSYGYGRPVRLYGLDELVKSEKKQVILCEGEWDRLMLQQEGFLAVTGTGGCRTFKPDWIKHFKGKDVIIIYDCDIAGIPAASNLVIPAFKESGIRSVKNVLLPLNGDEFDKDITDYFHKRNFTSDSLQELINKTPVHNYAEKETEEEIIELKSFTDMESEEYIDKKVKCGIAISGETSETFHAVETFKVTYCSKIPKGQCSDCLHPIKLPRGSQEYIGSCMSTNIQVISMLRDYCCRFGTRPVIKVTERTVVREFFCTQIVNRITMMKVNESDEEATCFLDGKEKELLEKKVYYISDRPAPPGNYLATGWIKTHPKTQQITFLIETLEPQKDEMESFSVKKNLQHLKDIQKLSVKEIIEDLRNNVTRIFKRDEILATVLLTYCSPLKIIFDDEVIRGWLSATIIGDSGVGKTISVNKLGEFIGIGDIFSGSTGSRTGLAYAMVEHAQKGWQVKIGRFPANTRKHLTVDEVQDIPQQQLKTIAKAMDEGFMQVDRVSSKGYESMTRLILMGNPIKDNIMDEYALGCATLKSIFPPTVIRRLDISVFANTNDIQDIQKEKKEAPRKCEGKVTKDMIRSLVYWIWKLKPENIVIKSEVRDACLEKSQALASKFGYAVDIPIISRYESEKTLIRVATAFAAIDASANNDFTKLIVKEKHIEMAFRFLNKIYCHDNCMLDEYSKIKQLQEELGDYDTIEEKFLKIMEEEKYAPDSNHGFRKIVQALWVFGMDGDIKRKAMRNSTLSDTTGCKKDYVTRKVGILKNLSLVEMTKDGYVKLPKFMKFLRKFIRSHPEFFEGLKALDEEKGGNDELF